MRRRLCGYPCQGLVRSSRRQRLVLFVFAAHFCHCMDVLPLPHRFLSLAVVYSAWPSLATNWQGRSIPAEVAASQLAARGYFDSLRAEVARDGVKVTTVSGRPPSSGRDAGIAARAVLAAIARGRPEVSINGGGFRRRLAGLRARARAVRKALEGIRSSR